MKKTKKILSEEHKRKIGVANSISQKGNSNGKNTRFQLRHIPLNQGATS